MTDALSRTLILDAAEQLFAQQGFAATSTKQIAALAGRNTALIHYYFADKAGLYQAVLARAAEQLIGEMSRAFGAEADPEETVRAVVRAQHAVLTRNPRLLPLLVREMLDWGAAHATAHIHALGAKVFDRLRAVIALGQARGAFRADVDPRLAAISLVSQMNWLTVVQPGAAILLGQGAGTLPPDTLQAFADHAAAFALAALRAPEQSPVEAGTMSVHSVHQGG